MDIDYEHFLNGICNSLKHRERIFRNFERELKHNLILSIQEESPFDDDPDFEVNFHFNGIRNHREKTNQWVFKFYMYSRERGVKFIGPSDQLEYQELLKALYEHILDLARMQQVMQSINT